MSVMIGKSIGRYHILEQLGEGGMAFVFKAYDTRLERDVAVKVIRKDAFPPAQLGQIMQRFQREAKALAKLSHPNIIKIHDAGEFEGSPYFVMEYLAGGTLKDRMGSPIPWREATRLLIPIARALESAHNQSILHRDVKPSNILLTSAGDPMLTDFGIAKILETKETRGLTLSGVGIGTPEYMAPEQGKGEKVDARADIYSLGIVFFELVTGRKPYTAITPMAVILKHINDPLPLPGQFVPALPVNVERVILKALAKKPENRYPDMSAFAKALENLLVNPGEISISRGEGEKTAIVGQPGREIVTPDAPQAKLKVLWPWVAGLGGLVLVVSIIAIALNGGKKEAKVALQPTDTPIPTNAPLPIASFTLTISVTPMPSLTPTLGIGSILVRPSDGMKMVYVPAGDFTMGDTLEQAMKECQEFGKDCQEKYFADEQPPHIVFLDTYWFDMTEVTNGMYEKCVTAGKCKAPSKSSSKTRSNYYGNPEFDNFPVVYVSWKDANDYCAWAKARLPSEAEWEKAARGTDELSFPWGNYGPNHTLANYLAEDTVAVGSFPAGVSPYGALDMAGNVWNWLADWYDVYPGGDPRASKWFGTIWRTMRGGTWASQGATSLRSSYRAANYPEIADINTSFRCASSAK